MLSVTQTPTRTVLVRLTQMLSLLPSVATPGVAEPIQYRELKYAQTAVNVGVQAIY